MADAPANAWTGHHLLSWLQAHPQWLDRPVHLLMMTGGEEDAYLTTAEEDQFEPGNPNVISLIADGPDAAVALPAPFPAVDQEAPMQITVTGGGNGGPGMRDINAAFDQHMPEDSAGDGRDILIDVLANADMDWHLQHGGSGALMAALYLEHLADLLLARYDIRERGETALGPIVTRAQIEAAARRIGAFSGREFQRHLDVPLAYQMFTDAGFSVEDGGQS